MKKIQGCILLIFIILLAGCRNKKENSVNVNLFSNPQRIDAQNAEETDSKMVLSHIFEGLTVEDANGKIIPAVAESWSVNGNVWTFNLDSNAKWHNGEQIKAEDFVTAWERVLNPKNSNKSAHLMFMIKGAMEYNQGVIIDFKSVGIKAPSDSILQVELKEDYAHFENVVAQMVYSPVNKAFYEKHKEKYGLSKKAILGNGPYKIKKWDNGKEIVLSKYDKYKNSENIKIENINLNISGNVEQVKKMYEENKLDALTFTLEEMLEFKKSKDIKNFGTGEVNYIQFNTKSNIFSNKKIRKAIAMAIDRKAFAEKFQNGRAEEAESFIPTNVSGKTKYFREEYNQANYGITFNPDNAKLLFQAGLAEMGMSISNVKNINFLVKSSEAEIKIANFIKSQLKENLNLEIAIKSETSQMRSQILGTGIYDFTLESYSTNVSSAASYLECWTSNNYRNGTFWSNTEYEDLLKNGLKEKDVNKRIEFFAKAEKVLMEELPIAPITFSRKNFLVKDRVDGVVMSNISNELNFKYATIKKSK